MGIKEKIELLEELRKLPEKKQWEVYFMIKGAALVAEKSNYVTAVWGGKRTDNNSPARWVEIEITAGGG